MSENAKKPTLYLIGGPNGSGKTTFATQYLPTEAKCRKFLNSDEIFHPLTQELPNCRQVVSCSISSSVTSQLGNRSLSNPRSVGEPMLNIWSRQKLQGLKSKSIFSGCLPHKNLTSAFSNGSKREDTTSHGLTCIAATQELWPICSTNIYPSPIAGIFGTRKIYHSI